jgi:hypothetical protein
MGSAGNLQCGPGAAFAVCQFKHAQFSTIPFEFLVEGHDFCARKRNGMLEDKDDLDHAFAFDVGILNKWVPFLNLFCS